tara:strand:+ start:83 stop:388 length:306 start_codon:yes stop_codon:yes gene_type:complete
MGETLTKSALIENISETFRRKNGAELPPEDIDLAVRTVIDVMTGALADGERIEIRGFGSFSLHHRKARIGRNPKTGASVSLSERYVPFFKPGKELRYRVNL